MLVSVLVPEIRIKVLSFINHIVRLIILVRPRHHLQNRKQTFIVETPANTIFAGVFVCLRFRSFLNLFFQKASCLLLRELLGPGAFRRPVGGCGAVRE